MQDTEVNNQVLSLETVIEEINLVKMDIANGSMIHHDTLINLTITLFKAFFGNDVNEGIIASIMFGEYSLNDGLIRKVFNTVGSIRFEIDSNNVKHIMCGSESIFRNVCGQKQVNIKDVSGMEGYFYFDENRLNISNARIILIFDEDGLVKRRGISREINSDDDAFSFVRYCISTVIWVERDDNDFSLIHVTDNTTILSGNLRIFSKRKQKFGYIANDSLFDLAPRAYLINTRFDNLLGSLEHSFYFRENSDMTRFFPKIKKAIEIRENGVKKRKKYARIRNKNNT